MIVFLHLYIIQVLVTGTTTGKHALSFSTMRHERKQKDKKGEKSTLEFAILFCVLYVVSSEETISCPVQCLCTKVRTKPILEFKLKCGSRDAKISSVQDLILQNLPMGTYHL